MSKIRFGPIDDWFENFHNVIILILFWPVFIVLYSLYWFIKNIWYGFFNLLVSVLSKKPTEQYIDLTEDEYDNRKN